MDNWLIDYRILGDCFIDNWLMDCVVFRYCFYDWCTLISSSHDLNVAMSMGGDKKNCINTCL